MRMNPPCPGDPCNFHSAHRTKTPSPFVYARRLTQYARPIPAGRLRFIANYLLLTDGAAVPDAVSVFIRPITCVGAR